MLSYIAWNGTRNSLPRLNQPLPPTVRLMALRRPMKRHRRGIHYDRSKPKQSWSRKRETWWKLKMWWTTGAQGRWWSGYWGGGGNLRKLWESRARDPCARNNVFRSTNPRLQLKILWHYTHIRMKRENKFTLHCMKIFNFIFSFICEIYVYYVKCLTIRSKDMEYKDWYASVAVDTLHIVI